MYKPRRIALSALVVAALFGLEIAAIRTLPDTIEPSTVRATLASMPVTKVPTRKPINPDDVQRPESPKECYDRLECGDKGGIQGCYRCCIGCASAIQTKCQDLCDGNTSTLTGWTITQVVALRVNHAEYMNAVHELFDAEHTVENAHRLEYLFTIGGVETLADTRCTVTIAAGALPTVDNADIAMVYESVLQSALTDPRDPAIRRTALACLTTAWGSDSIDAMQAVANAAINDDDETVRQLAVRLLAKWM